LIEIMKKMAKGGYTDQEILTTSRNWIAPATGWYRITLTGAGGGGGKGNKISSGLIGEGGKKGGDTIVTLPDTSTKTAQGGSGGGGGTSCCGGGGGQAGQIKTYLVYLLKDQILQVVIGAGGLGGTLSVTNNGNATVANGEGPYGGIGQKTGFSSQGIGAPGASSSSLSFIDSTNTYQPTAGGNGADNGTDYGNGGGGGGGKGNYASFTQSYGGRAAAGATPGGNATSSDPGNGGNGGDGAVEIEYFMLDEAA
jgi:hypothetical protein